LCKSLNEKNRHWFVVSNIGCENGEVRVFDTLLLQASKDSLRVISSMVFCELTSLSVQMMNVQRQSNGVDCGVLAIAIAFELCSGRDPCGVKFAETVSIRKHLATCLESCNISAFPTVSTRRCTQKVKMTQKVALVCVCRLPRDRGLVMAKCKKCRKLFHQHYQDIPDDVFQQNYAWTCNSCSI